jgi:hypothetical protein
MGAASGKKTVACPQTATEWTAAARATKHSLPDSSHHEKHHKDRSEDAEHQKVQRIGQGWTDTPAEKEQYGHDEDQTDESHVGPSAPNSVVIPGGSVDAFI